MSEENIRVATEADCGAMLALYRHLNPRDPDPDAEAARRAWSALVGSGMATVLVVEKQGALVASCTLVVVPNITRHARPYALVENVVTHAAHRNRGLGKRVLRAALDAAWAAGCYKVMLATGRTDEAVLRFYESAGFERGGKTFFQARRD